MKRNFRALLAALFGIAIVACACSKENTNNSVEKEDKVFPAAERFEVFPLINPNDIPYRIPAIATAKDGTLIAVSDYRHSGTDIGVTNYGRIDLHYRLSFDNGNSWTEIKTLINGMGEAATDFMSVGYGDPCIVADRESNRVLLLSCAGNVSFHNGTRQRHQNIARFYSEDGGRTWGEPEDIAESIYSQFDNSSYGPVRSMFVASGRILQSRFVKVDNYYRLYCAILARDKSLNATHMNYVLYSDDFGGTWKVLGSVNRPAVYSTAD
jgi:sialidase-1